MARTARANPISLTYEFERKSIITVAVIEIGTAETEIEIGIGSPSADLIARVMIVGVRPAVLATIMRTIFSSKEAMKEGCLAVSEGDPGIVTGTGTGREETSTVAAAGIGGAVPRDTTEIVPAVGTPEVNSYAVVLR